MWADKYSASNLHYTQCFSKVAAGSVCVETNYNAVSKDTFCASGLCGSDDAYCCNQAAADSGCSVACDADTGACTTKVQVGESCQTADDCYGGKACLGGQCCLMAQSDYTNTIGDTQYSKCTACADESHASPGQCVSCESGYTAYDATQETQAEGTAV